MKKLLLSALLLSSVSSYAQTVVKKVLLEDFTGRWCGFCVNGTHGIDELEVTYPTNFLPAAVHNDNTAALAGINDMLEIKEGEYLATSNGLGSKGFPSGAVDRVYNGTEIRIGINGNADQWKSAVAAELNKTAIVSISFANYVLNADGSYEADVNVQFESAPASGTPLVLQVYVLEDSIAAEQSNNLMQTSYTTWYGGKGSTSNPVGITSSGNNFYHNHTLRAALGGNWGYSIPTPTVGKAWTKHIKVTVPATAVPKPWVAEQLHMYAFVAYNGTTMDKKEVLNAEEIDMKKFWRVGVNDVAKNNVSILTAFPNPAKTNELIKISYSIENSETVTMNVYDFTGKKVAQPYVSTEVMGTHTIQWNPANDALTPGIYFVEVSTPSGKQVQRVSLF